MTRLQAFLTPVALLKTLLVTIAAALIVIGAAVVLFMSDVTDRSAAASRTTRAALRAAEAQAELARLQVVLGKRIDEFLTSPEVTQLPPDQRLALAQELHRDDTGGPAPGTGSPAVPLSMNETIALQDAATSLSSGYTEYADEQVQTVAAAGVEALDRYVDDPTPGNLRLVMVQIDAMLEQLDVRVGALEQQALAEESLSQQGTSDATAGILIALGVSGLVVLVLGQRIASTVRNAIEAGRQEQMELAVTTARLQFRNDQLNALYAVFSEITDTLSLEYVVNATLRESMHIMRADMATLRILRGNELVSIGAMASTGQEITHLSAVQLGAGPTGRTAKRGRTLRIEEGGERMMAGQPGAVPGQSPAAQTNRSPMEAGIIVPLVVGARVVGTLACWSKATNAFTDEDQRVLEMMASQVATAIAAADATESSERRAHQDPLTSLSNRRQLEEDLQRDLKDLAASDRSAVVAMLDIDYFKRLNDEYGHQVGDVALQRIAGVLRRSVRENDFVYRYGGEEFMVVFTDTTIADVLPLAERLRAAVAAVQISDKDDNLIRQMTISIGLALLPEHGHDMATLIDLADRAMYRAKANGRNCVVAWSEEGDTSGEFEAA
jgi:diguanylate cyclase (GGDEF)-like protein